MSAPQATQVGLFLGSWTHHTCTHSCSPVADNAQVQLQLLDTRQSVLDKVRQRPELLEQSFLMGHTSTPKALVLTQQGDVLVSLDDGGALLVWDMRGHRTCTAVPPASPDDCLHTVVAHPDGRHVLVGGTRPERLAGRISDSMEPLLCLLDAQTQRWVAELRSDLLGAPAVRNRLYWTEVTCLAISADGQYAVAGDAWGTLTAWDLLKRQHVATVEQAHSGVVCTLAFSPDLRQLVSGGQDHLLRLWDWDDVLAGKAQG